MIAKVAARHLGRYFGLPVIAQRADRVCEAFQRQRTEGGPREDPPGYEPFHTCHHAVQRKDIEPL